ncbi:sentrin-specific protease-like [Aphis gossypii]|uniref:sentrin-specific protease-like n=1 Tax=Aphis gossypii TaxID=80765 RepID=UPI00100F2644|nr:sentrin-specific protease-like [Aphis gossypii]
MDNEHLSNNLNQANSLELIEVIEEMTVDNDILENFLQEEYDEEVYVVDEVYIEDNDLIIDQEFYLSPEIESQDQEYNASLEIESQDQEYNASLEIESQDQEYNASQEIESQDQEYNTSYEMESPTSDQSLSDDCCSPITISDVEDTSNVQLEPTLSMVAEEGLSIINYIETPPNRNMFPGYNETIFNELKNFISNKSPSDSVNPSRDCGVSKFYDLLRLCIPHLWLNDIIIEQYIKLLIRNCKKYKVLNLGSFLFNSIDIHGFSGTVQLLLKKKSILDYDIVVVPAHLDDTHWALIVANLNERKIFVYDSFTIPYESLHEKMKIFNSFLNEVYLKKKLGVNDLKDFAWTIKMGISPLQENLSDCGVFVCTNARYHLFEVPINFNQGDIPLIRQRMSYELIQNTLLSTH